MTDEIYEHIYYEGEHIPLATLDGMKDRTITTSGASKTFSVTGWRIGTNIAPESVSEAIRKVHDFLTVGAPAPLQEGIAAGLERLGEDYYTNLSVEYRERREVMMRGLRTAGFLCDPPAGAYYVLADISDVTDKDDVAFAEWLTADIGVATVPGSSFYSDPNLGRKFVRFAFCKTLDMLEEATTRLATLKH